MAKRAQKQTKSTKSTKATKHTGKVGDDPQALKNVGGKGDFGIPARDPVNRATDGVIEGRPAGSAPGYSGDAGVRTTGVGSMGGPPGHDSGGDLDPDYIGLDGRGGLSAKPPREEELHGADMVQGQTGGDRSRKPRGRGKIGPGTHGAAPNAQGDYIDHSGEDTSTNSPFEAGSVKPIRGDDPGAEAEVNLDEATGDLDQGAEQ
ncbi:MAG TPA: hypothetical protein VLI90_11295 [Tepidisphaeraceae bacterium]|nr:hypothetical protein [Tepidisphaeraceae bacterium]